MTWIICIGSHMTTIDSILIGTQSVVLHDESRMKGYWWLVEKKLESGLMTVGFFCGNPSHKKDQKRSNGKDPYRFSWPKEVKW